MKRPHPQRVLALLATVALVAYGGLLLKSTAEGVGGSDSAGYANGARDLLDGRIVVPITALQRLGLPDRFAPIFRPLAHQVGPGSATMVPFYPPGFSLHVAAAAFALGWEAGPFVVNPILALLTVVLMYLLGRELSLSRPLAAAGAALLALCPIFLFQAVLPMSDIAAATWCLAAVLCALRSRRSDVWALAAGAAFGLAVLVRPTNAVILVPLACALAWRPRALALFAAGGAPFAVFLGLWNRTAYGSPLRTGYTPLMGDLLAWSHFPRRFVLYTRLTCVQLSPLPLVGWIGSAFCRSLRVRDRVMLLSWFALPFLFYCFWGPADNWTFSRYLLPGLPALIAGFLVATRDLQLAVAAGRARRPLVIAAALVVAFGFEAYMNLDRRPYGNGRSQIVYPEGCRILAARANGGNALVVSMEFSAALRFYTDLVPVRWDYVEPGDWAVLRASAASRGYRIFAVLFPHELEAAAARVPGRWTFIGNVRDAALWELAPD